MRMGTKSILFGAHCWFIHPWFVAWAWWKLYGFPFDPRLWVAFVVHDWGYWGLDKMDDEMGEGHPIAGAKIMHWLFDKAQYIRLGPGKWTFKRYDGNKEFELEAWPEGGDIFIPTWEWYEFVFYHSRFLSKRNEHEPSKLCYADKLAIALTPWWLYLPMVRLTGEIKEYQRTVKHVEDLGFAWKGNSWKEDRGWYQMLQERMRDFVCQHAKPNELLERSKL